MAEGKERVCLRQSGLFSVMNESSGDSFSWDFVNFWHNLVKQHLVSRVCMTTWCLVFAPYPSILNWIWFSIKVTMQAYRRPSLKRQVKCQRPVKGQRVRKDFKQHSILEARLNLCAYRNTKLLLSRILVLLLIEQTKKKNCEGKMLDPFASIFKFLPYD